MSLLEFVKKKWRRLKYIESFLIAITMSVSITTLINLINQQSIFSIIVLVCLFFILIFIVSIKIKSINQLKRNDIDSFLNREFPQLEFSAQLIEQDDIVLTEMARYQKQRLLNSIPAFEDIIIPNRVKQYIIAFLGVLIISTILYQYRSELISFFPPVELTKQTENKKLAEKIINPELLESLVTIESPAYTKIRKHQQSDLNIIAAESSLLEFRLQFSSPIKSAFLLVNQRDTIRLKVLEHVVKANYRLSQSGFYSIHWQTKTKQFSSDYYQLSSIKDKPAVIDIVGLKSYSIIKHDENPNVNFDIILTDDYGVTDASLIATLSKGAGESVKFREQEIRFAQSFSGKEKSYKFNQTINLNKLEMEPGDELFLFVKAFDNKASLNQESRTLTYIISMPDTARFRIAVSAGLPVNRMPDYFRSQRQIILDTEALIKQKNKIKAERFSEISNDIGIDQKLLRLRYGKFFGEEFESQEFGIAAFNPDEETHADEDDSEDPELEITDPAAAMEIIADFIHDHDAEEQDAFIEATVRVLMKQALSNMWDAELHLRMGNPKKALPFEYQALNLIKEATKKSRIYVERIGFEAPLLKPVKNRYKGELDQIKNLREARTEEDNDPYKSLRNLYRMLDEKKTLTKSMKIILKQSGDELVQLVNINPVLLINALKAVKEISENNKIDLATASRLKIILNSILPKSDNEENILNSQISKLQESYLMELQRIQ